MEKNIRHPSSSRLTGVYRTGAAFLLLGFIACIGLVPGRALKEFFLGRVSAPSEPFSNLPNHCKSASPINASEFHDRLIKLASILHSLNGSAYIAEPGASAQYFGNLSSASWRLSERPLLLIITPALVDGQVGAKLSILTPSFEATRAKMLPIPYDDVEYIEWAEDENPYQVAASAISANGSVFLDDAARLFIFDGFHDAFPKVSVLPAPQQVKEIRQRKSEAEIALLKCANEATLLAMRAVHKKMTIGMQESEASRMMTMALKAVGLENGHCLTLFGENAALPHGDGSDRVLGKSDLALFDCGGSLHGYISDLTRTVALPDTEVPHEHQTIWYRVLLAQTMAFHSAIAGTVAQDVDAQARLLLQPYAEYFTHRLGHGIGLEGHEEPYLRGGSLSIIKTGNVFSDEPGVYIEGKMGVRLEDCFYIDANGQPIFLTKEVGGQASSLWSP